MLISAIFRSQPATTPANAVAMNGASLAANYIVSNAIIQAADRPAAGRRRAELHRQPAQAGRAVSGPAERRRHAVRQDAALRGKRADIGIDLYNLFNGNTATAYDQGFGTDGSTWLRPTAVLNPRFVRFNVTFDF